MLGRNEPPIVQLLSTPSVKLSVPILAVVKIVCDQVAPMHRLGLLLGDRGEDQALHTPLK